MRCVVLVTLLACLVAPAADARRLPAPGGRVAVYIAPEQVRAFVDAHMYAPLLEPVTRSSTTALAHPPLPSFPSWTSWVLTGMSSSQNGRTWRLQTAGPSAPVVRALERCLAQRGVGHWPADVLGVRGVAVDVASLDGAALVRFSRPVGVAPELFAGCRLDDGLAQPTGAFELASGGVLRARASQEDQPPLLNVIELRTSPERADLASSSGEGQTSGTLVAPFPDVLLVVQSAEARSSDPLGLNSPAGLASFRARLRPDLLVRAFGGGRGSPAQGILPPGLAPPRPLPVATPAPTPDAPLALTVLPADAPRVAVARATGDVVLEAVVDRIAVLLRSRGVATELVEPGAKPSSTRLEVVRWRAPTRDPAIALLAFAAQRPELVARASAPLADDRLLSEKADDRLSAALALERAWLDDGVVVPLLVADRFFSIDPELRGVRVRADGVPLVDDAFWGGTR